MLPVVLFFRQRKSDFKFKISAHVVTCILHLACSTLHQSFIKSHNEHINKFSYKQPWSQSKKSESSNEQFWNFLNIFISQNDSKKSQ